MGIEYGIVENIKCDCKRCYNYLKTNPLCRLGRKTPQRYCKWFGGAQAKKENGRKINKKKSIEAKSCIKCEFVNEGFCMKYNRFASNARMECVKSWIK